MTGAQPRPGSAARSERAARRRATVPPVLVRQIRNGLVESEHRGDVVEADVNGRLLHVLGDPDRLVTLRSAAKPFSVVALIESGALDAFSVSPEELALMAASHSGEDIHVRTVQGLLRRAKVPQAAMGTGVAGSPIDAVTAARLARDGERPSPLRHMCSGQHSIFLLLAKLNGWPLEGYWEDGHPAMAAYRSIVARTFMVRETDLAMAIDGCGVPTFAFPLREVARAYAFLADPEAVGPTDPRRPLAPALRVVRDAMVAHPDLVGGTHDRLDTSLMKALPGGVVAKGGAEALRCVGIMPATAGPSGRVRSASGLALKIEDGGANQRGPWAALVEALVQVGVLDGAPLRALARYQRPLVMDPHGRQAGEAVAEFELAPVGELLA